MRRLIPARRLSRVTSRGKICEANGGQSARAPQIRKLDNESGNKSSMCRARFLNSHYLQKCHIGYLFNVQAAAWWGGWIYNIWRWKEAAQRFWKGRWWRENLKQGKNKSHSLSSSKCVSMPSVPGTEQMRRAFRNVLHLLTRQQCPPSSFCRDKTQQWTGWSGRQHESQMTACCYTFRAERAGRDLQLSTPIRVQNDLQNWIWKFRVYLR